ncbi:MAG: TetR family transcriptional regulator [Candidatus Delongbacteria bacterium]|jgi:TetR/AcrR family transcriptional regulator|nr:TetR family transcriptional regulator [Candidatus Delongbacteria bacterium]
MNRANNIINSDTPQSTEAVILKAASEVFMERGFDGARMQEIADRAGLNKALLHYYYRSKEKLFNAVFERVLIEMIEGMIQIFEDNLTVFESIRSFFKKHQEILMKNKLLPLFMLNEIQRAPELLIDLYPVDRIQVVRKKFYSDVNNEQHMGIIRKDVDPHDLFLNILSLSVFPFAAKPLLKGFYSMDENDFQSMISHRKENLADFVINAIKA